MPFTRIYGTGSYVPKTVRTNFDLERMLGTDPETGTTDEWIRSHVGIIERRIATKEEDHELMATGAIEDALARAGIRRKEASIILAGNTHVQGHLPCIASAYQDEWDLNLAGGYHADVPAFDVIAGHPLGAGAAVSAASNLLGSVRLTYEEGDERRLIGGGRVEGVVYLDRQRSLAQTIAQKLGMQVETSFDVITGCASFNYGLALADTLIKQEPQYIVVAAVDKMLDVTNPEDRSTVILFGELAGAAVLGPSEQPGFVTHSLHTDGAKRDVITLKQLDGCEKPYFWQDGQAVYKWAIRKIMDLTGFFVKNSTARRVVVPHQANPRMLQVAFRNRIFTQVADTIVTGDMFGNGSTASIAHALDVGFKTERIHLDDYVGIMGFGAGLSDCVNVYHVPE